MSDNAAKHFEAQPPSVELPEGRSVTLTITLHPNSQIEFNLPLQNKLLCYGLLEAARAQADKLYLLNELKASKEAAGGIAGLMRRMNGGG